MLKKNLYKAYLMQKLLRVSYSGYYDCLPSSRQGFNSPYPLKNCKQFLSEARPPLARRPANIIKIDLSKAHPQGGPLFKYMHFIYVLQSQKDLRTYVGYTDNIERRLKQHNSGCVTSTRHRKPLRLIYLEKFVSKQEAKKRELWWKSGIGRRKLKEFFK